MDFRKRIRFVRWSFFSKHKKQECAHAAREFPLVFSQRETKRAAGSSPRPPARPCGSSKQRATTQPVRRAFPNSLCLCSKRILTGVSNTWKGSFFAATQQDSAGAALAFRQRSVAQKNAAYESALKPCFLFCVLFSNDRKWQAYSKPKKALKARKAI